MNRHFEDAQYYLKRAGETAKRGVVEELEPIGRRFRRLTGTDEEPAPGRLEKVRTDLRAFQEKAEGEAREAIADARNRIGLRRMRKAE